MDSDSDDNDILSQSDSEDEEKTDEKKKAEQSSKVLKGNHESDEAFQLDANAAQIKDVLDELTEKEEESVKAKITEEVNFITRNFRQRFCAEYRERLEKPKQKGQSDEDSDSSDSDDDEDAWFEDFRVRRRNQRDYYDFDYWGGRNRVVCECGLPKSYHRESALVKNDSKSENQTAESTVTATQVDVNVKSETETIPAKSTSTDDASKSETNETETENKTVQPEENVDSSNSQEKDPNTEKEEETPAAEKIPEVKQEEKWNNELCTKTEPTWNFGNVKMYDANFGNYEIAYKGSHKFIRVDDLSDNERHGRKIYKLLVDYWKLTKPNLVVSVTGGDISQMRKHQKLSSNFRNGIMKTAVSMNSWILTDGLLGGTAHEVGEIFGEHIRNESLDNASVDVSLVAFTPWGSIRTKEYFMGVYVGSNETDFISMHSEESKKESLDPHHSAYIFADDGTYGRSNVAPQTRMLLEEYIYRSKAAWIIIVVVGGDQNTLQKVASALRKGIPVVVVHKSGEIANFLTEVYRTFRNVEEKQNKDKAKIDNKIGALLKKFEALPLGDNPEKHIHTIIDRAKLMKVSGSEFNEDNLNTVILSALCDAATDVSDELVLTLIMNRADIAKDRMYSKAGKNKMRHTKIGKMLVAALLLNKTEFVELLMDKTISSNIEFSTFLTKPRLFVLYRSLFDRKALMTGDIFLFRKIKVIFGKELNRDAILGKFLASVIKKDSLGSADPLNDSNLLPQVGRLIHFLLGNNYRLLYQENCFREDLNKKVVRNKQEWKLCEDAEEEAMWHLFLWAVLHNHREIAEICLSEISCKIGAALLACKMLKSMAAIAEKWHEAELSEDLTANSEYFEDLAVQIIDYLYKKNRSDAYTNLVAVLPFRMGRNITPLFIADDAECMKFMGHACCQTLLNLIWMRNMVPDTPWWKLIPVIPFLNICWVKFDGGELYGMFSTDERTEEDQNKDSKGDKETEPTAQENELVAKDTAEAPSQQVMKQVTEVKSEKKSVGRLEAVRIRVKNYYTAPVNKFFHGLLAYVVFLGIFSHMLLSELKPLKTLGDVSVYEWLVYVWVASILAQELQQFFSTYWSGPLYELTTEKEWESTWRTYEIFFFVTRMYRFSLWLSGRWNIVDALMIVLFVTSAVLRFTLDDVDFVIVRFFFSTTLIFFYLRLLRLGYISKVLGPRIITIRALVADLIQFFIVLSVFLISFGIAFQSIMEPNEKPSTNLLVDIAWRPYWQMFGELFVEDDGLGRDIDSKKCYSSRSEAKENNSEVCYNWLAILLVAIFMLITNIMLLNLLIAIFSHSFEKIEAESRLIWRYHLYDLIHEYYESPWLPPPFNVFCILANFVIWCQRNLRRKAYISAKENAWKKAKELVEYAEAKPTEEKIKKKADELLEKDPMHANFYITDNKQEELRVSHFRFPATRRNKTSEEWAYKQYSQDLERQKDKESAIEDLLQSHTTWMRNISSDIYEVKEKQMNEPDDKMAQASKQNNKEGSDGEENATEDDGKSEETNEGDNKSEMGAGETPISRQTTITGIGESLTPLDGDKDIHQESSFELKQEVKQLQEHVTSLQSEIKHLTKHITSDFEPVLAYVKRRVKQKKEAKSEHEKDDNETKE